MYFLELEVAPSPDGPNFEEFGGAQVVAWVRTDSEAAAHSYASRHLAAAGWIVTMVEKSRRCERSDFQGNRESLEAFAEAESEGGSITIHTWPNEPQADDSPH